MPDRIVRSVNETNGNGSQFMQSYQSDWMSHWKRTSCNTAIQTCNGSSSAVRNMELDYSAGEYNSLNGLKFSRSVKGYGEIETKTFEIMNESLRISSESLRNEGLEFQDFPVAGPENGGSSSLFKHGQDTDDLQALRPVSGHNSDRGKAFDCKPEIQETFVKSSSHADPYTFEREKFEFDKGKTLVSSLTGKSAIISNNHLSDTNLRILEHEYHHNRSQSVDLVCEGNMDNHSQPENCVNACFRESQKMQKCSGIRLFPSQFIASEKTGFKKSLYDCCALQKVPKCFCDVETMRLCTSRDSVVGTGRYPRFSQKIQSLLVTKKTDVNLSKENDIFRGTRVLGNTPSDLHSPSPFHGQGERGLKLQSLSSSIDSEGKGKFEYVKTSKVTIKNESSTETDTIDINSFKEKNPQPGAYSGPSNKAINMDWNFAPQIAVASSKHAGCRWPNTKPPDINLNLPALPDTVTLSEKAGPISSRTQSLEMDKLLAHAEQPKPKSNLCLDGYSIADPSNRWVKRLKLSSSHSSAQGTKSSNMAEYTSHEKMNKFFSRVLNSNSSITSSEPTTMKPCGKESMLSDERSYLPKEDKDFSMNPTKKGKELLLSHAWIQRWLPNGSCVTQKKSETVMFCEPRNSNLALEDLKKEQFPSIAAMALMGKAMSGFHPCELQKRGSFTVWNTKAF